MTPEQIVAEAKRRQTHYHGWLTQTNEILGARNGKLPLRWQKYFRDPLSIPEVNQVRMGHEDLTNKAAKVFSLDVRPHNNSSKRRDEAEKVERINLSYNDALSYRTGYDHLAIKRIWAWWYILSGEMVGVVLPDYNLKSPFFYFKDPRTHLPPIGWGPWSPIPLDNDMFCETEPLDAIQARYPGSAMALENTFNSGNHYGEPRMVEVVTFYSTKSWQVLAVADKPITLARSDDGDDRHPGICPTFCAFEYDGMGQKGRPALADSVPLQAMASRVLEQGFASIDAYMHPIVFTDPVEGGKVKRGWGQTNTYDTSATQGRSPRTEVVRPDSPVNVFNMVNFLLGYGRIQTRNPEMMQGAGEADSAKALESLRGEVTSFIRDGLWPSMMSAERRGYALGMQMDMNVWGNEPKSAVGTKNGSPFTLDYRPNTILSDYRNAVRLKAGDGVGGYQGTVERIQLHQSGQRSLQDVLEADPEVTEPREVIKRIQIEKLQTIGYELMLADVQQGKAQADIIAKTIAMMNSDGIEWFDAIAKLKEQGEYYVPGAEPMQQQQQMMGGGQGPDAAMALMEAMGMGSGQDQIAQGATQPALPAGAP